MRIWIAGGGTGGHVYPGLAVVQALNAESDGRNDRPDLTYVGGEGGIEEELAARAGLPFEGVPAGGVHGLGLGRSAQNVLKLLRGWRAAYRLGRKERPSAVFATGGYASVPVALAAWTLRVPILLYLPDVEPGLAVRFIARLASRVAVTVEDSKTYFQERKVVVTGYPIRSEFEGLRDFDACPVFGLIPDEPVLMVFGGSRGARSINRALSERLEDLLETVQIIHVSGEMDWPWVGERRKALPDSLRERYHAFPYLHRRMGYALAAADLAVCRAGASTLGELPFFGLPAVLVPYPHAWRYQRVNAHWLSDRGVAVTLDDERLEQDLLPTVRNLLSDRGRLVQMKERAQELARPDAAARLAEELRSLT
jgi:UDP-N-acetylglucosamine--N-acetylmuramyl-(pentapeptide) pyrophosphoryl-undecaprenol N-acetylglucosamine transferase